MAVYLKYGRMYQKVSKDDELYLPVDAVITAIFKQMHPNRTWNFTSINSFVKEHYKRDDIEVWDDLWFWGFFNQKVVKKEKSIWMEWKQILGDETDR